MNCSECFVKDCHCTCNTCISNHERNNNLSQKELDELNLEDWIKQAKLMKQIQ